MKRIRWTSRVWFEISTASINKVPAGYVARRRSRWGVSLYAYGHPTDDLRFKRRVDAKRWIECQLQHEPGPQSNPF